MIVVAVLLAAGHLGSSAAGAESSTALTTFEASVKAYTKFVTPRCAAEEIDPYRNFNDQRDRSFKRSLKDTLLDKAYLRAVREQVAEDKVTVYECAGPPPPPPPAGVVAPPIDFRARAILDAQKRLRDIAQTLPVVFDRGDALFAAMVAARDRVAGTRR